MIIWLGIDALSDQLDGSDRVVPVDRDQTKVVQTGGMVRNERQDAFVRDL